MPDHFLIRTNISSINRGIHKVRYKQSCQSGSQILSTRVQATVFKKLKQASHRRPAALPCSWPSSDTLHHCNQLVCLPIHPYLPNHIQLCQDLLNPAIHLRSAIDTATNSTQPTQFDTDDRYLLKHNTFNGGWHNWNVPYWETAYPRPIVVQ